MAKTLMASCPVTYLYGLTDPDNGAVRYVGKANDALARYRKHCGKRPSSKSSSPPVVYWIDELRLEGKKPGLTILCCVPSARWQEAERHWLEILRAKGQPLLNATGAGGGSH